MTSPADSESSLEQVQNALTPQTVSALKLISVSDIERKQPILELAKRVLADSEDVDEQVCLAVDYLQCQVDHEGSQAKVLQVLDHRTRLGGELEDLRFIFHQLRESLMETIRYGKRSEEVDLLLAKLTALINLVQQAPPAQPSLNLTGIEKALSPRCETCPESCRSAFRKVQVFIRRLVRVINTGSSAGQKAK